MSTKCGLLTDFDLLKTVTSTSTKPELVFCGRGRHLEKWIWRHISAVGASIWTKFGRLMQSNVRILGKWLKSKPKVDFQYGERLFFKHESSYISAVIWDMSTKFGLLTDFDLLKTVTSTYTIPEVVFCGRSRHLEEVEFQHGGWHISALGAPIWTKFGSLMQNNVQITPYWSRSKSEIKFQYGGRLHFETGSTYISAAIWDILTKFGLLIDFDLLKDVIPM